MGVPLMTLARHHRPIVAAWWFCFLGGPGVVLAIILTIRRRTK